MTSLAARGGYFVLAAAAMLAGILLTSPVSPAAGQSLPVNVAAVAEPVVSEGLVHPVFLTHAGDGTGDLYIAEKAGLVRVLAPDGRLRDESFLDIRDRVKSDGYEQGLLGLAFHPDFETNGRFFLNYTRQPDGATVISEFLAHEGVPDSGIERIVLLVPQPAGSHNAGMLAFDAGGGLVASLGDGGFAPQWRFSAQDPDSLLGKILRIDVDARPEADGTTAPPQVLAMGLRNPWRFSIDPLLGHIYIGDVGQHSWEEIDVLPSGAGRLNFGWSELEGPQCGPSGACDPAAHVAPVIAYAHEPAGTVIGGYAYRGTDEPRFGGLYIFGDHSLGAVFAAPLADMLDGAAAAERIASLTPGGISSFGEDESGELYVVGPLGIFRLTTDDGPVIAPTPVPDDLPLAPEVRSLPQLVDITQLVARVAALEANDPVPLDILYTKDVTLDDDGACVLAQPAGSDPYLALSVPSGHGLWVLSEAGGLLQVFLEVGGSMTEGQSLRWELTDEPHEFFMPPVSGIDGHVIRLDPPTGTLTRVCLVAL